MKQQIYWIVYDRDGIPHTDTLSYRRKDSTKAAELLPYWPWSRMKKHGWTVDKIHIVKLNP